MDIIYSASTLGAFSGSLFLIGFLFALGLGNALPLLLAPKRRRKRQIGGCVQIGIGVLLLLFGAASAVVTLDTYRNGEKVVQVKVVEKRETTVKCGKYYCTEYGVETTDGEKSFVFSLEKDVWENIQTEACYQFAYYPLQPLLADYLQQGNQRPNFYETTGYITSIGKIGCS
ncbi:MAG: hypothetical protein DPW18_19250 [Chloroflexi bacterium]|nr:hypothetical protein [Chloroflexota bacterium]MDL1943069.1 hypothetical protein [Chloroflexi bacterium CFX2]